jgi:uncharacterized ferritin-like protein (DUF455 family)
MVMTELRQAVLHLLAAPDADGKAAGMAALASEWAAGSMRLDTRAILTADRPIPGRPDRPQLVPPGELKRRGVVGVAGRAALMHALAHIEFNAINLALDAIWRFGGMPEEFYTDWLQVATEEARHYRLLADHLQTLGHTYGDFPAHNGLWEMADRTRGDVLARIALIPRTMEARGLDVSPGLRDKLAQAGDHEGAAILDIILRDEIGHVGIGNRWYGWLCRERTLDPLATYERLFAQYQAPALRGPFNMEARKAAGFTKAELDALLSPPCSAAGGS